MSTLALARPLWISAPECPPVSPPTATVTPAPSKGARVRGSRQALVLPPAQLTVKMPSASSPGRPQASQMPSTPPSK